MSGAVVAGMCRWLADAGVGVFSTDSVLPSGQVPITVELLPPTPDLAVAVTTYPGGPEPDSRNGWDYPRLQVRTRAVNPLDALDLDGACFDALQGAHGALDGTNAVLQDCYALQSEAQPLGPDNNGRHEYVRNYQLSIEYGS